MTANQSTRTPDGQRFEPDRQQIMGPNAARTLSADKAAFVTDKTADQKPLCAPAASAHALLTNDRAPGGVKPLISVPPHETVEDQPCLRACSDGPWAVELVTPRRSVTGQTFVVFPPAWAAYRRAARLALDGIYRAARLVSLAERRVIACAESSEEDNQLVESSKIAERRTNNWKPETRS